MLDGLLPTFPAWGLSENERRVVGRGSGQAGHKYAARSRTQRASSALSGRKSGFQTGAGGPEQFEFRVLHHERGRRSENYGEPVKGTVTDPSGRTWSWLFTNEMIIYEGDLMESKRPPAEVDRWLHERLYGPGRAAERLAAVQRRRGVVA
jgi:hypothetical protein